MPLVALAASEGQWATCAALSVARPIHIRAAASLPIEAAPWLMSRLRIAAASALIPMLVLPAPYWSCQRQSSLVPQLHPFRASETNKNNINTGYL